MQTLEEFRHSVQNVLLHFLHLRNAIKYSMYIETEGNEPGTNVLLQHIASQTMAR
jgi:hypothetical protein